VQVTPLFACRDAREARRGTQGGLVSSRENHVGHVNWSGFRLSCSRGEQLIRKSVRESVCKGASGEVCKGASGEVCKGASGECCADPTMVPMIDRPKLQQVLQSVMPPDV
jgi:hypothetical protein